MHQMPLGWSTDEEKKIPVREMMTDIWIKYVT